MRFTAMLLLLVLALPATAQNKKAANPAEVADEGRFSILMGGRKIGSESFRIERRANEHTVTSEIEITGGGAKAAQRSEMRLLPNGELLRYEWNEVEPGKGNAVVEPSDQMLIMHVTEKPGDKPLDLSFFMPASTLILEDYFFVHRQLAVWRHLANVCATQPDGRFGCRPEVGRFGTLAPRQHNTLPLTIEFAGMEKINIRGKDRDLARLNIRIEETDWFIWIDPANQFKVERITIPTAQTEVLRE